MGSVVMALEDQAAIGQDINDVVESGRFFGHGIRIVDMVQNQQTTDPQEISDLLPRKSINRAIQCGPCRIQRVFGCWSPVVARELPLANLRMEVLTAVLARNHLTSLLHRDLVSTNGSTFWTLSYASSVCHLFSPTFQGPSGTKPEWCFVDRSEMIGAGGSTNFENCKEM